MDAVDVIEGIDIIQRMTFLIQRCNRKKNLDATSAMVGEDSYGHNIGKRIKK